MNEVPDNVNVLVKIPDEDVQSGRHSMAQCWGEPGAKCCNPVAYRMAIKDWPECDGSYNTAFWCEKHKPDIAPETKFCKDCTHFLPIETYGPGFAWTYLCQKYMRLSLVTGDVDLQRLPFCDGQRSNEKNCGWSARWFEPRRNPASIPLPAPNDL